MSVAFVQKAAIGASWWFIVKGLTPTSTEFQCTLFPICMRQNTFFLIWIVYYKSFVPPLNKKDKPHSGRYWQLYPIEESKEKRVRKKIDFWITFPVPVQDTVILVTN